MNPFTTIDDVAVAYSDVCNIVFRALHPDHVDPDDGLLHTSTEARAVALQIFDALDVPQLLAIRSVVLGLLDGIEEDGIEDDGLPWWAEQLWEALSP